MCTNDNALNVSHQCLNIENEKHQNRTNYKIRNIKSSTFMQNLNDIRDDYETKINELNEEVEINYKNCGDRRPYIKIKLFDNEYQALLDTGATISVFGVGTEHLWNRASHIASSTEVNIKMPNGHVLSKQPMKMIPIGFRGVEKLIKVAFVPSVTRPLIMGVDFFHKFGLDIVKRADSIDEVECNSLSSQKEETIELPQHLKIKLDEIINKFPFDDNKSLGCQTLIRHRIDTEMNRPIIQHQYNYNVKVLEKVHKVVDEWIEQGVIEKSTSAWRNPIVVVKKSDDKIRVCLDARKLNSITKRDRFLTPNVFEALNSIPSDVMIFGRLDKNQAFLQTMLADEDKEKTAFFVKGKGLFHFVRMPFGLANAPATQTRLMLEIFGDLEPYVLVYFDDIIIMGRNYDHYFDLLETVAFRLKKFKLTISRDKMNLSLKDIKILGHIVSKDGIKVDSTKTDAINKWPTPTTKRELQRFIGMCNWYRRHIKDFSLIAASMTEVLKGKSFKWTEAAEESFKNLKKVMLSPPVLRPPRWEFPMNLLCDASNEGVGAALTQIDEQGNEFVIEYYSSKLTENERKFSPTEKECLAVIKAIKHFRPFIELMPLNIITDHYSLKYLLNMSVTSGRLARWILFLQPYVNCIQHRPGKLMKVPDALSRAPIMNSEEENLNEMSLTLNNNNCDEYEELIQKIRTNPDRIPNFRLSQGRILFKSNSNRSTNDDNWKIVPKVSCRDNIIKQCHEECVHGGIKCTLAKIRETWYWKRMRKDVANFTKNCFKCLCVKSSNKKLSGPMKYSRIPRNCMETVSIDIKGPFPASGIRRYRYIIVMIDILSRFAWFELCNDVNAQKIVKFMRKVFNEFKHPKIIIHDNGKQFTSSEFSKYLVTNNISSNPTPIYCAKNNPVERFNRTLGDSLRLYLLDFPLKHSQWHKFVGDIISKLNNRESDVTGFTPFVVLYGKEPKMRNGKLVQKLDDEHQKIINTAYENSLRKFQWNKNLYNSGRIVREFDAGSIVMVATHKLSNKFRKFNRKLAPKYEPATIKAKTHSNAYQIQLPNGRTVVVDVSDIKEVPKELQQVLKHELFKTN